MIYIAIIFSLCFLIWNILNETAVLAFFNTKDIKYIKQWHLYDAVLRTILIPYIILSPLGLNLISFKILITIGLCYHFGFNILLNYWRRRKDFNSLPFKLKIQILLYLSDGAIIDKYIISASQWINKKLSKLFNRNINIDYRYINLLLIILEIILIIWLWS